ncbi:MAG: HpcH/HpaI aldolase/citrate lyase family protein [Kiritimatiellia bacterium]|nr:aldolase [Lentisphaerota bacterium]
MMMRPSRVLKKLRAGEIVRCFKGNLADARVADIVGSTGFDCIWLDMEHVPNDWHVIEAGIWAASGHDMDVLVRVARGGYSDYIRPLELDAAGIMVPHIMSLEDARQVVRMTRFHPIGRRPIDGGNADGAFCGIDLPDYIEQANRERFVVVQIEDPEPMEELDAIAALPGIDMLFFGPGDFSQGIGAPGNFQHPRLLEARQRVAQAAREHGKFAGTTGSSATFSDLINLGYQFINIGADVVGLGQYCRKLLADTAASAAAPAPTAPAQGVYNAN